MNPTARTRSLFRDEEGFTTTSMALSLLITLALLFTAAQVYRINSIAADVQDVADAAALAAENQVAEFMVVARFCDAVVLSLTLTSIAVTGLGVAALCTPATAPIAEKLVDAGEKIVEARNTFADKAGKVLNKLQRALPFFAAAAAAGVAGAHDDLGAESKYLGVAVLVPSAGEDIEIDSADKSEELVDETQEGADEIRENAERAEEASQEANEAKLRAFMRDCGDDPSYCMYERGAALADMYGASNPLYTSVDAWSFSVALKRARIYYLKRMNAEGPDGSSVEDYVRSAMRWQFYVYAWERTWAGYVYEDGDSFDADIPHLPRNTAEMRDTDLYTDPAYLVTEEEGGFVMHAYRGCPGALGPEAGYASIATMEQSGFPRCPVCGFSASTLGRVASASTSIRNGFEYHYDAVADEAQRYGQALADAKGPKEEVKRSAGELLEKLKEALDEAVGKRIDPSPPGRFGAVAFVANVKRTSAAGPFASGFVSAAGKLGPRAAVSASTLLEERSDEGKTVVNAMLDGLREDGGFAVGAAGMVLDAWSWMLKAYTNGHDALTGAVEQGLNGLPLVGASGLGTWAADALSDAIEAVGLQPAELGSLKPVLVNSAHVAAQGEGFFAQNYLKVKKAVIAHPLRSTSLFSALLTEAESEAIRRIDEMGGSIEIASIELTGEGGPAIPITIPLPPEVKDQAAGAIRSLVARLRELHASTVEVRPWE